MRNLCSYVFPVLLLVAAPRVVSADFLDVIDYTSQLNTVKFSNRAAFLTHVAGDQWDVVTDVNGSLQDGDVLVSVFSATTLFVGESHVSAWQPSPGDFLLGYSVQRVSGIYRHADTGKVLGIEFGFSETDPFNRLNTSLGEGFKVFTSDTNYVINNVSLGDSVASVTDGADKVAFGAFGTVGDNDFSEYGVSAAARVAAYGFTSISTAGVPFLEDSVLDGRGPNDLQGIANFFDNPDYAADSEWTCGSVCLFYFRTVPEPGSFVLFAAGLVMGGALYIRRLRH